MEEEEKKRFVIRDKRTFDEAGEVRKEEPSGAKEAGTGEKAEKEQTSPGVEQQRPHREKDYPEVSFTSLVLSFSTTAMYHLGDFPDPATKKVEKNLPAAKQTIDILSMLKMKTEGNLDDNEKSVLESALYELMMRYAKEKTPQ